MPGRQGAESILEWRAPVQDLLTVIFLVTCVGIAKGGMPGLALDRNVVAPLGVRLLPCDTPR